jgi:hypothetical protein
LPPCLSKDNEDVSAEGIGRFLEVIKKYKRAHLPNPPNAFMRRGLAVGDELKV